ncbi:MAG: transcriptional regulator [Desulfobacteraceae bacterium]|nr:transcriptional regulator [Desulfobacteraceae bacterium]MBC2751722.1 transcriptional regulator [Desulfobacteraceae bacterium]
MINRLIKNEKDYDTALSRIDQLMDAKSGTAEMDELELLTALVEMYEELHFPISPPDPIDAIKFRMEQIGLVQKDMVPYIGTKSKVSEVLNGKRPLTLSMMRSLNKNLGISAEVLLKEPGADFPNQIQEMEWSRFPLLEMAKRNWIPPSDDIREKAEELIRDFIEQAGGLDTVPKPCFRQGKKGRYNAKMDLFALTAWCIRVQSVARKNPLKTKYVKNSIKLGTMQEVARLSYFDNGPLLAKEYLEKHGVHLIVVPHLPKTYIDGAAILLPDGTPVIGLTLRYDRIDYFWFCLLHELAHVSKHLSTSDRLIIDDLDLRGKKVEKEDIIEKEADEMTRNGLIPKRIWDRNPISGKASTAEIYALSEKLKIHPAIIAGRIRFEQKNYRLLSRHVGNKQIRKHFADSFKAKVS